MKKIKSIHAPFTAILNGTTRYALSDEFVAVPDKDAQFIKERWGNIVLIEDTDLTQTVDAAQTITVSPSELANMQAAVTPEALAAGAEMSDEEKAQAEASATKVEVSDQTQLQ